MLPIKQQEVYLLILGAERELLSQSNQALIQLVQIQLTAVHSHSRPVPGPIVGAGLPGLVAAAVVFSPWCDAVAGNSPNLEPVTVDMRKRAGHWPARFVLASGNIFTGK